MLDFLNKYRRDYFASQNGEEGILLEVVKRLGMVEGRACEIGGANGLFCSNTALLIRDHGWSGKFVEADYSLYEQCKQNWQHNPRVKCICSRVDEGNINAFVDKSCDVLSLDTDGNDYRIFKGLRTQPKVVIIEIDSSIPPGDWGFNSDGGASYREMVHEARIRDYFLLCHTGNLVLLRNEDRDLFPEVIGDGLTNAELYFNRAWIKEAA